ncbi:MAG: Hint domain-containing protein [Paracoccaceae bacterium]
MKPKTVGHAGAEYKLAQRRSVQSTGLVAGTLVVTADGELPVEYLTPGDRIVTRAHGMVPLKSVSAVTRHAHMIRLAPGALGAAQPRPAMMTSSQPVLLRGPLAMKLCGTAQGVTPIGFLVDDEAIRDLGPREMRLIQLSFERPEVIYADGVEVVLPAMRNEQPKAA